jgi:hypothetical protein
MDFVATSPGITTLYLMRGMSSRLEIPRNQQTLHAAPVCLGELSS